MSKKSEVKPGFTRVYIPTRGKTTRVRTSHTRKPGWLEKHGMVVMPEPIAPEIETELPEMPVPAEIEQPAKTKKPAITKMQPTKIKL